MYCPTIQVSNIMMSSLVFNNFDFFSMHADSNEHCSMLLFFFVPMYIFLYLLCFSCLYVDMISTLRDVERMQSITSKVETHQSFILFQNFFIHCISISYSM